MGCMEVVAASHAPFCDMHKVHKNKCGCSGTDRPQAVNIEATGTLEAFLPPAVTAPACPSTLPSRIGRYRLVSVLTAQLFASARQGLALVASLCTRAKEEV